MERIARINDLRHAETPERVAAYLPQNYRVCSLRNGDIGIIGEDRAGWTLDDYVIPRLASGLIWASELVGDEYRDEYRVILIDAVTDAETMDEANAAADRLRSIFPREDAFICPECGGTTDDHDPDCIAVRIASYERKHG